MSEKEEFMKHVRKEFVELVENDLIVASENVPNRMNSYEQNYLMQFWSNELLLKEAKKYIKNCFYDFHKTPFTVIESTYYDALKHKIIHLLIDRFQSLMKEKRDDNK